MRSENRQLLGHVLLPTAHEADARETAAALAAYDPETVTAVYLLEQRQAVGHPDPVPVEDRKNRAADALDAVQEQFPDVNRRIVSSREAPDAIFEVADEIEADAIVYRTGDRGRLLTPLTDDISLELVTRADRPVLALPSQE